MQYTGMMLLEEMASIFLTPYLLLFVVPQACLLQHIVPQASIFFFCILFTKLPLHCRCSLSTDVIYMFVQRVDDILQFIADFTVNVEGVGHVCRLSSSSLL